VAELVDVMVYLCKVYPKKSDLSNARLTKLIYLADWRSALVNGRQVTNIQWVFDQFGPFVFNVKDTAKEHPEIFHLEEMETALGSPKTVIRLMDETRDYDLGPEDVETLDWVVEKSRQMPWSRFIRLVYSKYPILTQERGTKLNLVDLAAEYKGLELVT
jgi:Protein of unknown function (DUF4065)